jgi:hypothetical protein
MNRKNDATRAVKLAASHPKSLLIDLQRQLESVGAKTASEKLGAIIGRLEAWQTSR